MLENWKITSFDSLELVRSEKIQMDAPKHFHTGYSIGIALNGLQTLLLNEEQHIIKPGSFMFLDPGEIHAHKAFTDIYWSHRMMYISPDYISWLQNKRMIRPSGTLSFQAALDDNVFLKGLFIRLHTLLTTAPSDPGINPLFDKCVSEIFNCYSLPSPRERMPGLKDKMSALQYYLDDHFDQPLNLEALAKQFKLSKFSLIRQFKRHTGITPNEYLLVARIEQVKKFILQGESLVSSALEGGFYDQSHFTHYFRKYTGVTPGQFQRKCQQVS